MTLVIDDPATKRFATGVHIAGACVAVVTSLLFYIFFFAPTVHATEEKKQSIGEVQETLSREQALVARRAKLKEELQQAQTQFQRVRARVPQQRGDVEFMSALSTVADSLGIAISRLVPQEPVEREGFSSFTIAVAGEANFPQVNQLIQAVYQMDRLSKVTNLKLTASSSNDRPHTFELDITLYFALRGRSESVDDE